jgi:hypothetical protein
MTQRTKNDTRPPDTRSIRQRNLKVPPISSVSLLLGIGRRTDLEESNIFHCWSGDLNEGEKESEFGPPPDEFKLAK